MSDFKRATNSTVPKNVDWIDIIVNLVDYRVVN